MKENQLENAVIVLIVGIVLLAIAIGIVQPFFESQSFNRLTGKNATYWDALWVELRVDGCN